MDLQPEKELIPNMGKVEESQKTYFFQREDGKIIQTNALEAWSLWNNRSQILGRQKLRWKLIGVSNGALFRKAVEEAQRLMRSQGLSVAQERLRKGEEEELLVAKGHIEPPPNYDEIGRGGNPIRISSLR